MENNDTFNLTLEVTKFDKVIHLEDNNDDVIICESCGHWTSRIWDEYIKLSDPIQKKYLLLLKEWVSNQLNKGIIPYGKDMESNYLFKFSDGTKLSFEDFDWADLVQAIVGKREGRDKYIEEE